MLRFCTRRKGAISVFLTLILVPTFIFGGVLVDGSRILGAKNLISGAGDMALNAALSDYNEELNKTYGLLARARTAEEVEYIMQDFFEATLNANGVSKEDFTKALVYLELTNDDFTASDIPGTEIYQTEVLKQEILEYMKYRAPVTLVNRAIDGKIDQLKDMEKEKNAADGQLKFESQLDGVQKIMDDIKECTDSLEIDCANTLDEAGMDSLLKQTMEAYRDKITMLAVAYHRMQNCSETEGGDTKALMKKMIKLSGDVDVSSINAGTASDIIQMIIIKNSMEGRSPDDLLDGLDPSSDEYEEMEQLIADYEDAEGVCEEGISNTEKQLKEKVEYFYIRLNEQRKYVLDGKEKSEEAAELISDLRDKLEKLEKSYNEWDNAVGQLPEGESRTAYEKNLEEYAGFFEENRGILGEFENKIKNGITFYSEMLAKLDDVTFMDKTLDKDITGYTKFYGGVDSGGVKQKSEITAKASELMERYHNTALRVSVDKSEIDFSNDEFLKKLKEEYCNTQHGNKAASQAEAEEQDESLEDTLKELERLLLTDDIEKLDMRQWELPSNWLGYRQYSDDSADGYDGQGGGVEFKGGVKDKESREQVADSGSGGLNNDNDSIHGVSSLADTMSKVGEEVAEPLFLTEYVMGMFSHYTSNYEDGEEVEAPQSLSRSELQDDIAYRAEIEYILWGSPNTRTNVRITKAIVFTFNFVYNMCFAFTNTSMRNDALQLSLLFPVGALAQTAIRCALKSMAAMVETTKNMMKLMKGEGVALVKTEGVWHTWLLPHLESKESEKGIVFTYEDYLWFLVCVKMFTGEQAELLARTADCIELNMTDGKSDDDNSMKDMYTMIDLETSVSIDTFFIQRLVGTGYYNGDFGSDMFKIKYYGIQGY